MTEISSRYARVLYRGQPSYVLVPPAGPAQLLSGAPWAGGRPSGTELAVDTPLLCPVAPSKIIGIGRNYRKHAEELKNEVPEQPLMFFKPPSSLLDPGGTVELPPESERVDYEGELVVVIGQRCRRITASQAGAAIFGYSIACDVTARDLQQKDKQWTRAKGFDTYCPLGPFVVQFSDATSPAQLRLGLKLSVNGKTCQDGSTADMIFDVPTLIESLSSTMTLRPGAVILTGTPQGVGFARQPPVWMKDGDRVVVEVEKIGRLENPIASE